jgi:hypothetical protein
MDALYLFGLATFALGLSLALCLMVVMREDS